MYKLIPKNLIKPRIPYTVGFKRFNTYDYGKGPECEFCNDLLFFAVGMYFGYIIGKR